VLTGSSQLGPTVAAIATATETVGVETLVYMWAVGGEFGYARAILSSFNLASILSSFVLLRRLRY
jgi:hypothetical protein